MNLTPERLPKKRLLVLTSTFPRWEGDREPLFVFDLCRRLLNRFEIHVVAPHTQGAQRQEQMDGIEVYRFQYLPESWQRLAYEGGILATLQKNPSSLFQVPFFLGSQVMFIRQLLQRIRFDAIHAHWLIPQGLSAILAQRGMKRVPIVCTSHGGDLFGLKGHFFDNLRRWIINRLDALTVVSHVMKEKVLRSGIQTPCWVIPMGTDLAHVFTPDATIPRRKATLLFVGRLVEKKGVSHLIKAFKEVLQNRPDAELWIVGSGPEESALQKQASATASVRLIKTRFGTPDPVGLPTKPGTITFFGPVPHEKLPAFYRTATATVIPSIVARSGDQEGLGLVIVEAMGCGCPVVASDLPAIRDVVKNTRTGLLVPPRNPKQLSKKILTILNDPSLSKTLSEQARKNVIDFFDWTKIVAAYDRIFTNFR